MSATVSNTRKHLVWVGVACGVVLVAAAAVAWYWLAHSGEPSAAPTFSGDSSELKRTQIVATLDTPIEEGKNAIWCASFECAWKELQQLVKAPVGLEGDPPIADRLNGAADPRPTLPAGAAFSVAGFREDGIYDRIRDGLKAQFPSRPLPELPEVGEHGILAYAYLEANVKFTVPYFQNRGPLAFREGAGKSANVTSFGVGLKDMGTGEAVRRVRSQARVLFHGGEGYQDDWDFAVDLCAESAPSQIVVARIPRQPDLARALERVQKGIQKTLAAPNPDAGSQLDAMDVLLVPDLSCRISHCFKELKGRHLKNAGLTRHWIEWALQDIAFRLDRSGAELRSEAILGAPYACVPRTLVFDRPFLIYMQKRGAEKPYFVMWVDNAELLRAW